MLLRNYKGKGPNAAATRDKGRETDIVRHSFHRPVEPLLRGEQGEFQGTAGVDVC